MPTLDMTPIEREQVKVLYTAIYVGLGLIPQSELPKLNHDYALKTRSLAHDLYDSGTNHAHPRSRDGFNQKFPTSLGEVVQSFRSQIKSFDQKKLVAKWRFVTRINSDSLVLRYIRDNTDMVKAAKRVGAGLAIHMEDTNAETELSRGEAHYINSKADANYIKFYSKGIAYFSGVNNVGAPVMFFCIRHHAPKHQTKEMMHRVTINLYEHAFMSLPDGVQGLTMVWDMKNWSLKCWDSTWIFSLVKYARDCYPGLLGKIYLMNCPRIFNLAWKMIHNWMHQSMQNTVVFTRNIDDILVDVPASQLPRYFGGTSAYDSTFTPPREEDELDDPEQKKELLETRDASRKEFEQATIKWLHGANNLDERARLLTELEELFYKLDPHVRRRYVWDRHGSLGLARSEFAEGGISQPKCKIDRPLLSDPVPSAASADTDSKYSGKITKHVIKVQPRKSDVAAA